MTRGRPPKATKVLELNGAYKKNPQRRKDRANEPQTTGPLPPYPGSMEGRTQEDAYNLIVASAPLGVLTDADLLTVLEMSRLLFLSWNDACTASERHLLLTMLGKLGMNPSDRARLQVAPKEKPKNRWSDVG
jgi:hypothetical protein